MYIFEKVNKQLKTVNCNNTQWARKFKKVQIKKIREVKWINFTKCFLAKLHFLQFPNWPKINFWTGKNFKTAKNTISWKNWFIWFHEFFLPGLFLIFWPALCASKAEFTWSTYGQLESYGWLIHKFPWCVFLNFCEIIAKNEEKHVMEIYRWVIRNFPVVRKWTRWIWPILHCWN